MQQLLLLLLWNKALSFSINCVTTHVLYSCLRQKLPSSLTTPEASVSATNPQAWSDAARLA